MLSYVFWSLKQQKEYEEIGREEFENIHELFAAILSKVTAHLIKRGLYREYLDNTDNLTVLRGRINMPGTIKNKTAQKQLINCEYDNLSENNLLNQILKTTVILLIKHGDISSPKCREYINILKKEMLFFSEVEIIDKPKLIKWSDIHFHKDNLTYNFPIFICKLVIEDMLLTENGNYKMASFINEQRMSALYEQFIFEYYKKEWKNLKVGSPKIKWDLDYSDNNDRSDDNDLLPNMQTDVTLSYQNKVLIIDAKYYENITQKIFNKDKLHSNNLYQIFAYVKNYKTDDKASQDSPCEVSGMLLYAGTVDGIQPDNTYTMSGNKISVKTLDLNREFKEIQKQLDKIANDWINGSESNTQKSE